jgi:uncharacterized protein (TIGR03435 family)
MRALVAVALVAGPVAGGDAAQQVPAEPPIAAVPTAITGGLFDAASIRVNTSGDPRVSSGTQGRTYAAMNMPLRPVILIAYELDLQPSRLLGGPSWLGGVAPPWIGADRFDIVAKLPDDVNMRQVPAMLRALLAERFKLAVHTEVREAPAYALVLARSDRRLGTKLRKAAIDCAALEAAGGQPPPVEPGQLGPCDAQVGLNGGGIEAHGQVLSTLARMITQFVGRQVIDRTGLSGGFDFELQFSGRATTAAVDGAAADGVSLFTALEEQLGLKLESTRVPVEFVVIDRLERPTEN